MPRHDVTFIGGKPLSIAIMAMGGQGGGVLADWIVATAESRGWVAQSTSVPGVAQRTGATIYYIEMLQAVDGKKPVLSLMPAPGDVDVVLATEYMEAGRSILRGLVTPARTTLIASTHRALAISEKAGPGNGVATSSTVAEASGIAAKRVIAFDMEKIAVENGSVISAAMLGALAGAGVLPFPREAYEAAIRVSAKGIAPSLKTFAEAFSQTKGNPPAAGSTAVTKRFSQLPAATGKRELDDLVVRIRGGFQVELHDMLFAGVRKLTDFQDARYATAYLDRMSGLVRLETSPSYAFALAAAKHVANAMAYDDVIRVADLKTKASRFDRVKAGAGVAAGQIAYMTEFMHPRMEEIVGILPDGLGRWLENRPRLFRFLDRRISRGRRVRTGTVGWFLVLYAVAALRPLRRRSLRHHRSAGQRQPGKGRPGDAGSSGSSPSQYARRARRTRAGLKCNRRAASQAGDGLQGAIQGFCLFIGKCGFTQAP